MTPQLFSRDHPDTIKRRVLAVSAVTLAAPAVLSLFSAPSAEGQLFSQPLLQHVGVSRTYARTRARAHVHPPTPQTNKNWETGYTLQVTINHPSHD